MKYCTECGYVLDEYLQCPNKCGSPNVSIWNGRINFNYECPDCHGKFNYPVIKQEESTGTMAIYRCPFCMKVMKGM